MRGRPQTPSLPIQRVPYQRGYYLEKPPGGGIEMRLAGEKKGPYGTELALNNAA